MNMQDKMYRTMINQGYLLVQINNGIIYVTSDNANLIPPATRWGTVAIHPNGNREVL